ncbi:TonB-dependent receptor [Erythrobacter vulgaris]|uniref:TonB-dependent receptor n=1 Tax=Qipengyuania vulgaris TaxID=291985 RepID=A0A844XUI7_9SPHN|nr:TonB-dependent receptor [Qipengyuania vulgaris]MXO49430.1 TonB-dependent receptor [Qipengyuania vulgaris]
MRMLSSTPGVYLGFVATAATFSSPSFSQVEASEPIEEIVVTAQHREELAKNVPIAVSVVSGEDLRRGEIRSLQELGARATGLVTTDSVNYGFAPLSIRGVGGANGGGNIFADEPVAVYQDGALVARLRMSTADLLDIKRIEVLRGPQGVLFGRNSTAGAVLIHSAEPTTVLSGHLRGSVSSIGTFRMQGAVSGPIDDDARLSFRLAGGGSWREGFGSNAYGERLNGGHDARLRAFLRFKTQDKVQLDLIGEISRSRNEPGTIAIADLSDMSDERDGFFGGNVVFPFVPREDLADVVQNSRFALNRPTYTELRGTSLTARGEAAIGKLNLVSITSYRSWKLSGAQDSDGTAIDPIEPPFVAGRIGNLGDNAALLRDSQFSQELRLASSDDQQFSWMVGGYWFEESNQANPVHINNRLAGAGGGGTTATFRTSQKTSSWAGFLNLSFRLTDTLSISGGLRYTNERKDFLNSLTVRQINAFDPPGDAFIPSGQVLVKAPDLALSRTDDNVASRLVLEWHASNRLYGFISYNGGFKSGGFNAFRGIDPEFAPEGIDAFEIGIKVDPLPWLRGEATAFHYAYRDLQVRTPVPTGGIGIESLARARLFGGEIELSAAPIAGLKFDAGLALLNTKILEGRVSALRDESFVFGTAPPVVLVDVGGNELTRAPDLQAYASGRYSWKIGGIAASAQLTARHQSSIFFLETQQQSPTFRAKSWQEFELRLGIGDPENKWEVAVFARNLTDNRHFTQITAFFGLPNAALNAPRSFGLAYSRGL